MLIRFSVENWMSFQEKATFSMVASRERQHSERVFRLPKFQIRLLPVASIYGGNASGKSNFWKAFKFCKEFVTDSLKPEKPIPIIPFRLVEDSSKNPSSFCFEILLQDLIYEYSFSATSRQVLEEKLVEINSNDEKVLFHRKGKTSLNLHPSLKDSSFLEYAHHGTQPNQLFLSNSVSQNISTFEPIYDWFRDTLQLVSPESRFGFFEQFLDETHPLCQAMNEALPLLDTGIHELKGEDVPFHSLPLPEEIKTHIQEDPFDMEGSIYHQGERFVLARKNANLSAKKLVTLHAGQNRQEVKFSVLEESDGSRRIIELLPAFLDLARHTSDRVYVIDELDRSLHTLLTRRLLENYLKTCSRASRSQLLFTTHDVLQMDQNLLRRDEMWVTERDQNGCSQLYSFSDYKDIRNDKDIRKSYLHGRLGGIPRILMDLHPQPKIQN